MNGHNEKIAVVNGLRGLAILAVLWQHVAAHKFELQGPQFGFFMLADRIPIMPYSLVANGWMGVNLFFVLSGFVLAYPFFKMQRSDAMELNWRRFYWRRAQRLLPLFYINVFVGLIIVAAVTHVDDLEQLLAQQMFWLLPLLFVFNADTWFPITNPLLWSLGIEVWFSLIFPVLMLLMLRYRPAVVLLVVALMALVVRWYGANPEFYLPSNSYVNPVKDSVFGRLDDFAWGMFICCLYVRGAMRGVAHGGWLLLCLAGLITIVMACWAWDYLMLGFIPPWAAALVHILTNVGFAAILWGVLNLQKGWLRWFFACRPMQILGLMCFSIYIWHGLIQVYVWKAEGWVSFGAFLMVTTLLCLLSYRYIEFGAQADWRKLFLLPQRT